VTGTSQGDTPSPSYLTATFDIPLRALELTPAKPFLVRNERDLIKTQDFLFAEDVLSLSSRREGLQDKADIMSATAAILGILFAILKLRTSAKNWGQEPFGHQNTDYLLVVHDRDWQVTEVPVEYATPENGDQSFRYLGVQMDNNNQSKKQFTILNDHLSLIASTARNKMASPDTIVMAIKLSTHR